MKIFHKLITIDYKQICKRNIVPIMYNMDDEIKSFEELNKIRIQSETA